MYSKVTKTEPFTAGSFPGYHPDEKVLFALSWCRLRYASFWESLRLARKEFLLPMSGRLLPKFKLASTKTNLRNFIFNLLGEEPETEGLERPYLSLLLSTLLLCLWHVW